MKKTKTLSIIFIFILLTAILSACGDGVEKIKDIAQEAVDTIKGFRMGQWDNNVYTNEKFGLTVSLPEEWYIYSQEELEGLFGETAEALKDSEMEIEEGLLVPMFFVTDNNDVNSSTINMSLTTTRSLLAPNLDDEYTDEVLAQMAAQMEQYGEVDINKVGEVDLGGEKAFLITMDTAITGTEIIQSQRIYQLFKSGYLLTFTMTASDEAAIDSIESNISFE